MTGLGNEVQMRIIAEQIAEAAIIKISAQHKLPSQEPELPAPLKWAGALVVAVATACAVAMAIWMVTTLSDLQQTVTRIDERQKLSGDTVTKRLDDLDGRITRVELSGHPVK